jgi:hypothetical protein
LLKTVNKIFQRFLKLWHNDQINLHVLIKGPALGWLVAFERRSGVSASSAIPSSQEHCLRIEYNPEAVAQAGSSLNLYNCGRKVLFHVDFEPANRWSDAFLLKLQGFRMPSSFTKQ